MTASQKTGEMTQNPDASRKKKPAPGDFSDFTTQNTYYIYVGPRGLPLVRLVELAACGVPWVRATSAGVVGRACAHARVCADSDIVLLLAGPFLKHICIYVSCGLCDSCGCRPWHIELLSISTAAQLL